MVKLNLGCGPTNFGKDWIHIDSGEFDHIDKRYKSIVGLDFAAESVDLIYASHVLEYFDRKEATKVLLEGFRVLKKGGILRLAVPDFEVMANLYCKGEYPLDRFLGPLYGKMSMADETIYHKTVYDMYSIKNILQNIGFKDVCKFEWRDTEHSDIDDCSQAYLPHMNKDNGTLISLNIECKRKD